MNVLVTGGLGYIGSHTVVELINSGHTPIILDNLANSKLSVLDRLKKITKADIAFEQVDLTNKEDVEVVFGKYDIDAVIHFAGHKAVGESIQKPLEYYRNNIDSTLALMDVMTSHNVKSIIFSSSATVYGDPSELPLKETSQTGIGITNPYGWTKYMLEQILSDVKISDDNWNVTLLRYFNPIGAHDSGLIGEDPSGLPNNLLPYVQQVAIGKLDRLSVFGDDYDTPDGTGVRDYIHVVDLAKGHVAALNKIIEQDKVEIYNLGTGSGVSVLEIVKAFEQASGKKIKYEVSARRPGDIATCYADTTKASQELNWKTEKSLEDACRDAWHWQQHSQRLE